MFGFKRPHPRLDPVTAALHRKLDHIIRNQERTMSAIEDLATAYAALHQTIADDIAQENVLLQKIADANAANNSDAIVALVRQMTQDNADMQATIAKSKTATDAVVTGAPPAAA